MKIYIIDAGYFTCDGGALFSVIPKVLWQKAYPADENNMVRIALRCMLIDDGERKILIEAGVGNHYSEKFIRNNGIENIGIIENSLKQQGFSPEDITDVLFTHLHWDHCNGAVKNINGTLELTFPNASHWCSKTQWEHAQISNKREQTAYFPQILQFIKENGNLQLVEKEGELLPDIDIRFFDGHTPRQMIPFIHNEGKTIVYMSDLIPTAANIPIVWLASYDLYPVTSLQEKEEFLKEAAERNYILFFEHDYYSECASVKLGEKGPEVKETFNLI